MKKLFSILVILTVVSLFITSPVAASEANPVGACPPAFELHHTMDHTGPHMHPHIGADQDSNVDGFICMKMLPNDLHLHVDNTLPLP